MSKTNIKGQSLQIDLFVILLYLVKKILAADSLEKLVEILVVLVVKGESLFLALVLDLDLSAELTLNSQLHLSEVIHERNCLLDVFVCRLLLSVNLLDLLLELSYREVLLCRKLSEKYHILGVFYTEKSTRVTCAEFS